MIKHTHCCCFITVKKTSSLLWNNCLSTLCPYIALFVCIPNFRQVIIQICNCQSNDNEEPVIQSKTSKFWSGLTYHESLWSILKSASHVGISKLMEVYSCKKLSLWFVLAHMHIVVLIQTTVRLSVTLMSNAVALLIYYRYINWPAFFC